MITIDGFLILAFIVINIILYRQNKQSKIIKDLKSRLDYHDAVDRLNKKQHNEYVARIDDICEWCKTLEKGRQGNSEDLAALLHESLN
jgi:hypothetical protein